MAGSFVSLAEKRKMLTAAGWVAAAAPVAGEEWFRPDGGRVPGGGLSLQAAWDEYVTKHWRSV